MHEEETASSGLKYLTELDDHFDLPGFAIIK